MEKIKDVLPAVFKSLENPEVSQRQKLTRDWEQIVGKAIAGKTQARLAKSGQLVIWVSESALAHEIQSKYRAAILKRARALLGEKEISDVVIRVGQLR